MMIYEPKGRAREYSPLALNIYTGCDHGCKYCYVPRVLKRDREEFRQNVAPRKDILQAVEKEAAKRSGTDKQVLLCFSGDPYCRKDEEYRTTRSILKILLENRIPVAILTKGGTRCLQDLDVFKKFGRHIKVGATLVFIKKKDSEEYEPDAAPQEDRLKALKTLHAYKIRTWASFEPVIDTGQSLFLMKETLPYVDEYKVGKINQYGSLDKKIEWEPFLRMAIEILRNAGKPFYVKEDLRERCPKVRLTADEKDMNRLLVPGFDGPGFPAGQSDLFS